MAQANISPAPRQDKKVIIMGAMLHIGNGNVIDNGYLIFERGKITGVGDATVVRIDPTGSTLINANGKHIYPGFIAPLTNLGLAEFESVKATLDFSEMGNFNPHIRSLVAYNTDSKVPATLRSNGVLMAQITPQGGLVTGSSSVVQLDAWNWEDAAIRTDGAMHVNWPATLRLRGNNLRGNSAADAIKEVSRNRIAELEQLFIEAKAYADMTKPEVVNTRLEAMKRLFSGTQQLFIAANSQTDIMDAVKFAKKFNITPVITGADEAYLITDFLKSSGVSVVIGQPHALPSGSDEDVNLPYRKAGMLMDAGIPVALSVEGYWQQRNLPFMAGTVSAWGLNKERALQTITLNAAQILGIADKTGSLEIGKDATLFISAGDALDMRTNRVEQAFIQGRDINLDNLHKQLDKKFSDKYRAVPKMKKE
ncbi:amidohydrolase family protein [Pedobacter deserti]|uniref:amidohydrolase family protein n=1 Tax=Pedobacter deserti TaxID=2817382 RepID=UPI0021095208|nr:amidohydrolase family protein [Pedobacter sp. SYSU D00382]